MHAPLVALRLVANSAKGRFSDDWVAWPDLAEVLQAEQALTCSTLQPLFAGRSINTGGFMLAVLRHLGVVQAGPEGNDRTLYQVQTILGHSDPKVTMRYAKFKPEALVQAASAASLLKAPSLQVVGGATAAMGA